MPLMARDISALIPHLKSPKKVLITTHAKPDGDAMGSSLALKLLLEQLGHTVTVVVPTDYPDFLYWMPNNEQVLIYPDKESECNSIISGADMLFCLDFNHLSRIKSMQAAVHNAKGIKVMIDHHLNPSDFDDYRLSKSSASSTAELVYEFYETLKEDCSLNKDIAACIYTGIMTDTGSFRFDSTTARVHRIVADLVDQGINVGRIHNLIYDSFDENRLRLLGYLLDKKMTVLPEYKAAYISLNRKELLKFNVKTGDTEGIVNYPLGIRGIEVVAMIIDRSNSGADQNEIRLSLRSIGDIAVNEISGKYFNGGGHKNAAGGQVNTSIEDAINKFVKAVSEL